MPIGISDWLFRHSHTGEQLIRQASEAGFEGIEFNVYEGEGQGPITMQAKAVQLRRLAADARLAGMRLPSLATSLHNRYSLTSHRASIRRKGIDIARSMMDMAVQLGAKVILIVPGHVDEEMPYDRAYALAQEAMISLASDAESAGITIAIENVWSKFLLSPLEFRRFLDELNHPSCAAYLDVGNTLHAGYPEQWIRLLGDRIVSVHLKDLHAGPEGRGERYAPFFNGTANWSRVAEAIRDVDYEGFVIATPLALADTAEFSLRRIADSMSDILRRID